jgi:protein O-GlcNAc transferase
MVTPGHFDHAALEAALSRGGRAANQVSELVPALMASGLAHQQAGRLAKAEHCYLAALRVDPGNDEAMYHMGVLGLQCGNGDGALAYLSRTVAKRQGDADALYNMGMANVLCLRLAEAEKWFQQALAVDPGHATSRLGLGNLCRLLGRVDEWTAHYRAGLESPRLTPGSYSNLLLALHSSPLVSVGELYALHREWERRYAAPLYDRWQEHANDRSPERKLRVGFVSSSFYATSVVGHFLRGVLRALRSHGEIETCLYANSSQSDWITAELKDLSHQWCDILALDDEGATARIRSDRVDILIDLNGHAPGHRLLVFARKPAPIQVSWLDYFDTTGLEAIDYLITDPVSTAADTGQRFAERLLLMPAVRLCFTAPPFAPEVAPLPALSRRQVTFGCFTRSDKIGPNVLEVWARILAAIPDSRLVLKSETLRFPEVCRRFEATFGDRGIDPGRLELRTASSYEAMLAQYADVDIALDSFPYNGGATTCDALWMGVPVVARRGESLISRQSAAMLEAAGLSDLIARDDDGYVQIAVSLAADVPRLDALRKGLRPAIAASPLCDADAFADALVGRLRLAWREWCAA